MTGGGAGGPNKFEFCRGGGIWKKGGNTMSQNL